MDLSLTRLRPVPHHDASAVFSILEKGGPHRRGELYGIMAIRQKAA